jgi:molybdopterin molybdotransferase
MTVGEGQCAKIMTGAMLPEGTDKVIKVELTSASGGRMIPVDSENKMNVCLRGEDVRKGEKVLGKGVMIRPAEVGIMASMGVSEPEVYKIPKVVVMATGSEIIEPGTPLSDGKIFNSNGYSLQAQLLKMGIPSQYGGIITDDRPSLEKMFSRHLDNSDVIIVSGGVSMGDFDFVPSILNELGVSLQFDKVAVKPGKPTVFGERNGTFFWGLPGNPVSTFVIFEVFVKPFLYRMMGHEYQVPYLKGTMKDRFLKKKSGRTSFVPVKYDEGEVEPVVYHGSAHFDSLSGANGLLQVPAGVDQLEKGKTVYVRPI